MNAVTASVTYGVASSKFLIGFANEKC